MTVGKREIGFPDDLGYVAAKYTIFSIVGGGRPGGRGVVKSNCDLTICDVVSSLSWFVRICSEPVYYTPFHSFANYLDVYTSTMVYK